MARERVGKRGRVRAGGRVAARENPWLLLIHQIPPKPNYLRVKIGRRLQRLGAVALKNSVYVLPRSDHAYEDLQWVAREIVEGGGDASVCEASFLEGVSDGHLQALFNAARDADYAQLAEDARAMLDELPGRDQAKEEQRAELGARVPRLMRRMAEIGAIDFFGAPGRGAAEGLLSSLARRLAAPPPAQTPALPARDYRGRTWVTRKGIHVDRMASAWLIRRFIDPGARFKFVAPREYRHRAGELRFDMFDGEFTHEGDRCSFEVLSLRLGLNDPALRALGEIVHDIDLKDGKFGRPEAAGLERLVAGIAMSHQDDVARLERASDALDDLYEYYRRKRPAREG